MSKISVIVPVYKVEQYIDRCLESILNQTYSDLEIILVDDGSPDNCGKICDEYAKKDNRIKVIHKENGGLSSARNAGLDIATGDYIGFVDSDDWIHPQMYEIALSILKKIDADFISFKYSRVDKYNNDFKQIDINECLSKTKCFAKQEVLDNFFPDYYYKIWMTVPTKLYKKSIFDDLHFQEGYIHEDDLLLLPSIDKSRKIAVIEEKLYYYFMSENSIIRSSFSKKNYDTLYVTYTRYKWFKKGSRQYNLCLTEHYKHYLIYLIFTHNYFKEGNKEINKYKKILLKNSIEIITNPHICKMYKLMIFSSLISVKVTEALADKYFDDISKNINYLKKHIIFNCWR